MSVITIKKMAFAPNSNGSSRWNLMGVNSLTNSRARYTSIWTSLMVQRKWVAGTDTTTTSQWSLYLRQAIWFQHTSPTPQCSLSRTSSIKVTYTAAPIQMEAAKVWPLTCASTWTSAMVRERAIALESANVIQAFSALTVWAQWLIWHKLTGIKLKRRSVPVVGSTIRWGQLKAKGTSLWALLQVGQSRSTCWKGNLSRFQTLSTLTCS